MVCDGGVGEVGEGAGGGGEGEEREEEVDCLDHGCWLGSFLEFFGGDCIR